MKKHLLLANILRWSAFTLVFSRGLLYIIFDSPYRSLLWNEDLFGPIVNMTGMTWRDYANSSDSWISIWENLVGSFLVFSSFLFLTIHKNSHKAFLFCLHLSGAILLFHIFLHYLGHNHELPIIPEYMVQGLTPWIFLAYLPFMPDKNKKQWLQPSSSVYFWTKAAIALCFLGHGLYAFGIPYQPASFVRLMSKCLFVEYETAAGLVMCVGLTDIVLAVLIYVKPLEKIALGHIAYWGFATALSRVLAYVIIPGNLSNLNPWFLESSVRIVHGSLPLFLLFLLKWEIIKTERLSLSNIKMWTSKWQAKYALAFITLFFIAGLSANGKLNFQDKMLTEKSTQKAPKEQKRVNPQESLKIDDFKTSKNNNLYSDSLFSSTSFPTRTILDCHPDYTQESLE